MSDFYSLKQQIMKKQKNYAKKIHGEELAEENGKEHEKDHGIHKHNKELFSLLEKYETQLREKEIKKSQWFSLVQKN